MLQPLLHVQFQNAGQAMQFPSCGYMHDGWLGLTRCLCLQATFLTIETAE